MDPALSIIPDFWKVDRDLILDRLGSLWEELRGERLFITGGTGFFGTWILQSLAWANTRFGLGASAVVLTRNPSAFWDRVPHLAQNPAFSFHPGDVRDFTFPAGHFSHIIHGATTSAVATYLREDPLKKFDTIVSGTRHTLDFAVHCGARRLLLTSSGAAYGRQPADLTHISEDYPGGPDLFDPASALGEGKRAAELLCALYAHKHGLETKIARCFTFVGPHLQMDIHYAIGNFIRDAIRQVPIRITGDGTPRRSYLYASDLMVWLWTILLKGNACRIYNVGSEKDLSILELATLTTKTLGSDSVVEVLGQSSIEQPPNRYVPSTLRARSELHLSQTVDLESAIRRTATHYATVHQHGTSHA